MLTSILQGTAGNTGACLEPMLMACGWAGAQQAALAAKEVWPLLEEVVSQWDPHLHPGLSELETREGYPPNTEVGQGMQQEPLQR